MLCQVKKVQERQMTQERNRIMLDWVRPQISMTMLQYGGHETGFSNSATSLPTQNMTETNKLKVKKKIIKIGT